MAITSWCRLSLPQQTATWPLEIHDDWHRFADPRRFADPCIHLLGCHLTVSEIFTNVVKNIFKQSNACMETKSAIFANVQPPHIRTQEYVVDKSRNELRSPSGSRTSCCSLRNKGSKAGWKFESALGTYSQRRYGSNSITRMNSNIRELKES